MVSRERSWANAIGQHKRSTIHLAIGNRQSAINALIISSAIIDAGGRMKDLKDLIGNAEEFPILRKWNFFNHAGVSPLPRLTADAFRRYADQAESTVYLNS